MTGPQQPTDAVPTREEYLAGLFHRTTMLLGESGMARLKGKTVAVAGCGGVGGAVALTLARLGVGGFVLADPGIFDPPDGNRQWAASRAVQGRNKTDVHAELLRNINPDVRLTLFPEGITEQNLERFLAPADLLLDCLDISVPVSLRGQVYRGAMARGLYAVSAPNLRLRHPDPLLRAGRDGDGRAHRRLRQGGVDRVEAAPGFPDHYFVPHVRAVEREIHKHRVPTSAISVTLASGLVAAEIARIFLREEYPELEGPPVLPQVFAVEPLRRTFRVLHYSELFRDHGDRAAREAALASAHHDVVQVPSKKVAVDLLSDSWSDLPMAGGPTDPPSPEADPRALLAAPLRNAARDPGLPRPVRRGAPRAAGGEAGPRGRDGGALPHHPVPPRGGGRHDPRRPRQRPGLPRRRRLRRARARALRRHGGGDLARALQRRPRRPAALAREPAPGAGARERGARAGGARHAPGSSRTRRSSASASRSSARARCRKSSTRWSRSPTPAPAA